MSACTVCGHPHGDRALGAERLCGFCVSTLRDLLCRYSPAWGYMYELCEGHVVALRRTILATRELGG